MGFWRRVTSAISAPFRRSRKPRTRRSEPTPEVEAPEVSGIEDVAGTDFSAYRIVDYKDTSGEWRNTDPKGTVTTDGSRFGQGDEPPTTEDIEGSPWVNVGFQDEDGGWYYRWIQGPFDAEFWIDDAIEQIAGEYGIAYGSGV